MPKPTAQLDREIAEALARRSAVSGARDVTDEVLRDSSFGPGEHVARVAKAKPARDQTPQIIEAAASWERRDDKTMGRVSKPLAYSRAMPRSKRDHSNLIRLIKGGHLRVYEIAEPPPPDSTAKRDAPYSDRYYIIASPSG